MTDTAKSLTKSKASGAHGKVATNAAAMVSLDEEFSAFFDKGDAGDYEGGFHEAPLSVDPVTYDEPKEERSVVIPTRRRAFLAKMVSVVVAGCATLMVIALSLKSIPTGAHARPAVASAQAVPAVPTPNGVGSPVVVAAQLPPVSQQERTIVQPVSVEAPQTALVPAVPERTIVEPVAAEAPQGRLDSAAKTERQPEPVPAKSSVSPPAVVKRVLDNQPVKPPGLAHATVKNSHSRHVSTKNTGDVRQAPIAASKPSVVSFPVD